MTAFVVAVTNSKGGTGKTTLALQIAITKAITGSRVLFIDADRQRSGYLSLQYREDQLPGMAPVSCESITDGRKLVARVSEAADDWDVIVIDSGGFDSQTMRAALLVCTVAVIPFQPRSVDIWAMRDMAELVAAAQEARGPFPALAVLSFAKPVAGSADNMAAAKIVSELPPLTYVDAPIVRREAYATAVGYGQSVMEARPRDRKAAAEITRLMDIIFKTQGASDADQQPEQEGI